MTRGRKKDLTIPPSRALTQQRDYRARKAQYLAELEERCRRVEQENEALRRELDTLRAGLPLSYPLDPRLVSASSELMKDLAAASCAIERFQKLAYPEGTSLAASPQSDSALPQTSVSSCLRPAFFPSPSPSLSEPSLPECESDRLRDSPERCWPKENARAPESLRKILCLPDTPNSHSTTDARRPKRLSSFTEDSHDSDMTP